MKIRFRNATIDDAPAIVTLVDSTYRGESSRGGWTTEADLLGGQRTDHDDVAEILSTATSQIVLGENDEHGLIACCQIESRSDATAYFGMFSVNPSLQGGGIGRAMVVEAERRAVEELGATTMRMSVIRQREELIAWYLRLGYSPTGEVLPFPYGNERFGVPKRDDLAFIVLAKALV